MSGSEVNSMDSEFPIRSYFWRVLGNYGYGNDGKKLREISFREEGGNWCPIHQQWIEDDLVNVQSPACIKEHNGCANCPHVTYRTETTFNDEECVSIRPRGNLLDFMTEEEN